MQINTRSTLHSPRPNTWVYSYSKYSFDTALPPACSRRRRSQNREEPPDLQMIRKGMSTTTMMDDEGARLIRHSGRAHIRGKIRRIWRPRYLELMDNGLVRYYECDEEEIAGLDREHINMIPKCTLQVFRARIIDVTTLRDVHVGLPRGTYGFLFHARRLVFDDLCVNGDPNESRDFLCHVPTLEEAQSWVVALQWASSHHFKDEEDFISLISGPYSTRTRSVLTSNDPYLVPNPSPKKSVRREVSPRRPKAGKIVVPKVQSVRAVKEDTLIFSLAYKIKLLVLASKTGTMIEERVLLRSRNQVEILVEQLFQECMHSKSKAVLETVRQKLQQRRPHTYREHVTSVAMVDSILRILALDAQICNSAALRSFWSLDVFVVQSMPLLRVHRTNALLSRRVHNVRSESTDSFVKQWLQDGEYEQYSKLKGYAYFVLQRPILLTGCIVLPWLLCNRVLSFHHLFGTVNVSWDILCLSWILACLSGKEWEKRQRITPTTLCAPVKPTLHVDAMENVPSDDGELVDDEGSYFDVQSTSSTDEDLGDVESEDEDIVEGLPIVADPFTSKLSSPLPRYPDNGGTSCWSKPPDNIFRVRSATYLQDRVKTASGQAPFHCRGVDVWLTDNPERHIARHRSVLGGRLGDEDTFLVNFLLPFGNFVSYYGIPPIEHFPDKLSKVWTNFIDGDQQYRDARLKLLPVVVEGPWIVKAAVGPGTSPALLGKAIPLQYYFRHPSEGKKGVYEVDVIITASSIAKGILSVVKGHTKALTIAFGFIIEAADEDELPETVLCNSQIHALNLEDCPQLPAFDLDEDSGLKI